MKTVIPQIDCRCANIYDCLFDLSRQAKEQNTDKRELVFLVYLSSKEIPTVTFSARNISVGEALKILSEICKANVMIDDTGMIHFFSATVGRGNVDFAKLLPRPDSEESGDPIAADPFVPSVLDIEPKEPLKEEPDPFAPMPDKTKKQ